MVHVVYVDDVGLVDQPGQSPYRTRAPYRERDSAAVLQSVPRRDADHRIAIAPLVLGVARTAAAADDGDVVAQCG